MSAKLTIQDVFKRFYLEYTKNYFPTPVQMKAAYHILNCKTGAYGKNTSVCEKCGHIVVHNNSCRDRSCPMCQAVSNELWIDEQRPYVLDIDYYHVVFTCPSELYPLLYCNQKTLYSEFYHCVSETLMEMAGDIKYLGGKPGFICIMHTWSSDLSYHPHIHVLLTGGGLDKNNNWHQKRNGFFIPGKPMALLFKGKFLSSIKRLYKEGKLIFDGMTEKLRNSYSFKELLNKCYSKNWVTNIKESFAGAETVMHYIGRYTHRIAIGNSRIIKMDNETVTFRVKDYKNGGTWKELTVKGIEFIRRFLLHIPPKRFVRIRYYGLLCNQQKKKLIPICRNIIGCREFLRRFKKNDKVDAIKKLYNHDVTLCPCCGGHMKLEFSPRVIRQHRSG